MWSQAFEEGEGQGRGEGQGQGQGEGLTPQEEVGGRNPAARRARSQLAATAVVARSPDRATLPDRRSPRSQETFGQPPWPGREALPQLGEGRRPSGSRPGP